MSVLCTPLQVKCYPIYLSINEGKSLFKKKKTVSYIFSLIYPITSLQITRSLLSQMRTSIIMYAHTHKSDVLQMVPLVNKFTFYQQYFQVFIYLFILYKLFQLFSYFKHLPQNSPFWSMLLIFVVYCHLWNSPYFWHLDLHLCTFTPTYPPPPSLSLSLSIFLSLDLSIYHFLCIHNNASSMIWYFETNVTFQFLQK